MLFLLKALLRIIEREKRLKQIRIQCQNKDLIQEMIIVVTNLPKIRLDNLTASSECSIIVEE